LSGAGKPAEAGWIIQRKGCLAITQPGLKPWPKPAFGGARRLKPPQRLVSGRFTPSLCVPPDTFSGRTPFLAGFRVAGSRRCSILHSSLCILHSALPQVVYRPMFLKYIIRGNQNPSKPANGATKTIKSIQIRSKVIKNDKFPIAHLNILTQNGPGASAKGVLTPSDRAQPPVLAVSSML
jgi:hypothetical protein